MLKSLLVRLVPSCSRAEQEEPKGLTFRTTGAWDQRAVCEPLASSEPSS